MLVQSIRGAKIAFWKLRRWWWLRRLRLNKRKEQKVHPDSKTLGSTVTINDFESMSGAGGMTTRRIMLDDDSTKIQNVIGD